MLPVTVEVKISRCLWIFQQEQIFLRYVFNAFLHWNLTLIYENSESNIFENMKYLDEVLDNNNN